MCVSIPLNMDYFYTLEGVRRKDQMGGEKNANESKLFQFLVNFAAAEPI